MNENSHIIIDRHKKKFIKLESGGQYAITTAFNQAYTFYDYERAINIKNKLPELLKETEKDFDWEVISWEADPFSDNNCDNSDNNCENIDGIEDIDFEAFQNAVNIFSNKVNEIKNKRQQLLNALSNVDKEISDIMHYIENCNFNACQGYKLCRALKVLRGNRRKIKNELELIQIINNINLKTLTSGKINNQIQSISNRGYTPRVLVELFKDDNVDFL